jgi:hypothetical protein
MGVWGDLGRMVADSAPMLGALLPVPGGAVIGSMIAAKFGGNPNNPKELLKLVQTDPKAAVKLREIELGHEKELQALSVQAAKNEMESDTSRLIAINATMQAESRSEDSWTRRWRPAWGFISAIAFGAVVIFVCILAYQAVIGKQPEALTMIPQLVSAFATLFGIPLVILGVAAHHRGKMQRVQAGEQTTTPLAALVNGFKSKTTQGG